VIIATDGEMSFSQFRYDDIHEELGYLIAFDSGDGSRGLELARRVGEIPNGLLSTLTTMYRIDGKVLCSYTF